jgi:hypothetical protein
MTCTKPLRRHPRGATWRGIKLVLKDDANVVIPLTGVQVDLHVREKKDVTTAPVLAFSTLDNTILVETPENGTIIVVGRQINVRPFNYVLDIKLTMPNGDVIYFFERTWEIYQTVTK